MPFTHVADSMVVEPVTVGIQNLLCGIVFSLVAVPASTAVGNDQQVVHDSCIGALPPADQYAADFLRSRLDRVPTRKNQCLARDANDRRMERSAFSDSHG